MRTFRPSSRPSPERGEMMSTEKYNDDPTGRVDKVCQCSVCKTNRADRLAAALKVPEIAALREAAVAVCDEYWDASGAHIYSMDNLITALAALAALTPNEVRP